MKTLPLVSIAFVLIFPLIAYNQGPPAPMAFGKISKKDLAMTVYAPDTSAAAVVLCDYGVCRVIQGTGNFRQKFTRHKRIKILKKAGFGQADIPIPFYSYKKREQFYFDRAQIKLP